MLNDVMQNLEAARIAHEANRIAEAHRLGITPEELDARKADAKRKDDPSRAKWLARYDGIQPRSVLEAVYDGELEQTVGIRAVEHWLSAKDHAPCLVLLGGTGAGKTVAALHAARKLSVGTRFIRAPELGAAVRPTMDERKVRSDVLDPRNVSLLIIDDLGAEQLTPRLSEALFLAIDARQDVSRRTIITSNLSKEDFRPRYDSRVVDRLNAIARVASLGGDSLRPKRAGL